MNKDQLITKAEAEQATAKAVAAALAKAEEDKKKAVAEAVAKAESKIEEAVKAKEKEIRYQVYQELLAYQRRKIPCRNYAAFRRQ